MKKRVDRLIVELGLAESREKAQALILAGDVLEDDQPATKAGMPVSEDAKIRLKAPAHPYVSRGGVKLEGAANDFGLQIEGKVCLDIGSSTGGFTHYMLLNGAARIYAVDVDVTQLDWKIRNDPRVRKIEMNARFLAPSSIGEQVDLATVDASFISLTMLLPRIPAVLKPGGACLTLVKPQFEVGRGQIGKGGVVKSPELHRAAIDKVVAAGREAGMEYIGVRESRITGREGNKEFFALFRNPD